MTIFNVTNWAKLAVTNWAKLVSKKNNLAQLITIKNCARTFFLKTQTTWSKIWGFFESKLGPRLRQNLVQDFFACFFPNFIVFFGYLKKTQIVCRGAKIIFWQFVRLSKKGFRKKMCTFCFCLFYVGERKEKTWKKWKTKISKKAQKNSVFGVVVNKMVFFCKNVIF